MTVHETIGFVMRHGCYALVLAFVFAEQIGLPVPSTPILLAGGALIRTGHLHAATVLLGSFLASLVADVLWYELGRRRGSRIMRMLCRISLEPDSCVRRTENAFGRHGARALVIAKFVPGLNTAAPPMAGISGMRRARFLLFDAIGALAWLGAFLGVGWLLGDEIETAFDWAERFGIWLGVLVVGGFALYIGAKWLQRHRFLRDLRIARIEPEELHARLQAGEDIAIIDLRHSFDFDASPSVVPGAIHIPAEEIDSRENAIPRDREIILYCT